MQSVHIRNAYSDKNLSNPSTCFFCAFTLDILRHYFNNNRISKDISLHTVLNRTVSLLA